MRRHKEFLITEDEPEPTPIKVYPNYMRALRFGRQYHQRNKAIESGYHNVIAEVKQLYAKLATEPERTYFEMDRKALANSVEDMHTFITPHLYFELMCTIWDQYWVYFALQDCPFKDEVERVFRKYSVFNYLKEKELKEPLKQYFKVVQAVQPKEFIKTVNPDDY